MAWWRTGSILMNVRDHECANCLTCSLLVPVQRGSWQAEMSATNIFQPWIVCCKFALLVQYLLDFLLNVCKETTQRPWDTGQSLRILMKADASTTSKHLNPSRPCVSHCASQISNVHMHSFSTIKVAIEDQRHSWITGHSESMSPSNHLCLSLLEGLVW